MIGTKDVPVEENKPRVSSFIKPGINENISIVDVTVREASTGNTGITFHFASPNFDELDGKPQTGETTLWLGEKTKASTEARISDLASAAGVKSEIDAVEGADAASYAAAIKPIICNKPMRIKFTGTEVEGKEGKSSWFKAELPWKYFAESQTTDLESTSLRFDATSNYDMKKLPAADVDETFEDTKEEMPF